jgi:hypothetical protein
VSVRAPETAGELEQEYEHDNEYDLLTAALIGATIGAGLTYVLRRSTSGQRPLTPMLRGLGRSAVWTGQRAAKYGVAGARWAADRGDALWERIPRDEIREHVSDYVNRAREAIDDAVESELRDLRRTVRRQRKRLGI